MMCSLCPGMRTTSTPGATSQSSSTSHHWPALGHRLEIVGEIAGAIAFGGMARVFELAAMDHVTGVGKRGHGLAIDDAGVPSAMVEMQVGIYHEIDLLGPHAVCREMFRQARALEGVNILALRVPFIACARLDQHPLPCCANQERIHGQRDAVAIVGGDRALPHGLGNDAEHGAAVEPERAVVQDVKFEVAKFHGLFLRSE